MKQIWKKVSNLGIKGGEDQLKLLSNKLFNQINAVVLVTMFILLIILRITARLEQTQAGIGSLRVLLLLLVTIGNVILAKKDCHLVGKISLIIFSPVIFIVFPTLIGFVEEEGFTYYPYVLIAFSIIPHLILTPFQSKLLFRVILGFYFLLVLYIDRLMIQFAPQDFIIVERISSFYLFYKLAHIAIFMFIHLSVHYLRKLNYDYEQKLNQQNQILDKRNIELKKAFDDLELVHDQMVQSEKMASLGILTAGMAHEINNPLNYISGAFNMIEESLESTSEKNNKMVYEEIRKGLKIGEEGLKRVTKIIESLLMFSYKGKSEKKLADPEDLVDKALIFLKSKIENSIKIEKEIKTRSFIPVHIDKLHQVLVNVIDNAIFAVNMLPDKKERKINIKVQKGLNSNKEFVFFEISNNGPYIDENDLKHIFDPFFTTKDVGEGNGLGLSISYNIIKDQGGEILAENRDGMVRFKISLPIGQKVNSK